MNHLEWISQGKVFEAENYLLLKDITEQDAEVVSYLEKEFLTLQESEIDQLCSEQSLSETLKIKVQQLVSEFQTKCDTPLQVVSDIYTLVGLDCGSFKRLLDDNLISWGYFIDHNPFEPHCNAHPNNFVILDLEKQLTLPREVSVETQTVSLLAPVDFDMAYEFSQFIGNVEDDPKSFGKQDRELFDNWTGQEKYELQRALGGEENMANFSYGADDQEQKEKGNESEREVLSRRFFGVVKQVLRDICVYSYNQAYDKNLKREDLKLTASQIEQMSILIKIALLLTDNAQT